MPRILRENKMMYDKPIPLTKRGKYLWRKVEIERDLIARNTPYVINSSKGARCPNCNTRLWHHTRNCPTCHMTIRW